MCPFRSSLGPKRCCCRLGTKRWQIATVKERRADLRKASENRRGSDER
jgi:hypothetical protein